MTEGMEFRPRETRLREKRQVRFFAKSDLYRRFTARVKADGLFIQDVFEEFMDWFASRPVPAAKRDRRRK